MGKENDHLERAKYTRNPYVLVSKITKSDRRKNSKKMLLYLFKRCAYKRVKYECQINLCVMGLTKTTTVCFS